MVLATVSPKKDCDLMCSTQDGLCIPVPHLTDICCFGTTLLLDVGKPKKHLNQDEEFHNGGAQEPVAACPLLSRCAHPPGRNPELIHSVTWHSTGHVATLVKPSIRRGYAVL